MKIGLTYDLRSEYLAMGFSEEETAEFDREDTIESLENALHELGHETERIGNVYGLVAALAQNRTWDLVFNIAEGYYGFSREAQIPALLEAYTIPYTFSDPMILSLALHKGMTKQIVRAHGVPTPDFAVVTCEEDIRNLTLTGTLFAKPVAEGTSKGISNISKIETREELETVCRSLLAQFKQPVLVERFLPGREFTVGITGTGDNAEVVGVIEILSNSGAEQNAYSYQNKKLYEQVIRYELATDEQGINARTLALQAWKALGCRDAGRVDVREDENGVLGFIEVNPLAGLHPGHSDLPIICTKVGVSYTELIRRIVTSAVAGWSNCPWMTKNPMRQA